MSKKWTLLPLILFVCSSGTLQANPLDSPGVVYIDGLPCNSACQSYMAWSYQALAAKHREERTTDIAVPAETGIESVEHASPARVARQPIPRAAQRAIVVASKAKPSNTKKAAASNPVAARKDVPAPTATVTPAKPIAGDRAPERKLETARRAEPAQAAPTVLPQPEAAPNAKEAAKSEVVLPPPATLEIAAPATRAIATDTAGDTPASAPRTIRQQVVEATGLADLVTAIGTGREASNISDNPEVETSAVGDTDKTASASDSPDNLVALVLARPEISSLSDLNNKSVAIEEKQSASSGRVSAAFMAAGAAEVQFSEGQAGAIDRLISGEVPAAVLTLASRQAAEWFPDIAGFRTFRIPLAQKARL